MRIWGLLIVGYRTYLIDAIPEKKTKGFFDIGRPEITVSRVVLRLIGRMEDEARRESAISQILEGIETYSSQLNFIHTVGHRENVGAELTSETFATQIHDDFVARLLKPLQPNRRVSGMLGASTMPSRLRRANPLCRPMMTLFCCARYCAH